jgi:threonine dehydrogenase-like Zn-dependent dehydrogenase
MWAETVVAPGRCERLEVDPPRAEDLQEGQVLLSTLAAGICGSDLPAFLNGALRTEPHPEVTVPGFPLHEVAGEVLASRDAELPVGARVVGWASGRNAGAELLVAEGSGLLPYAEGLSPAEAVALQPLACAIQAVQSLPAIAGSSAAVLGLGPIGLLFAHVLKDAGAGSVTGIDRVDRSDVAETFGIDELVTMSGSRWVAAMTEDSPRPDLVVEAVGHQVETLSNAVDAVADRGRILYFGIPEDPVYPFPLETFLRKNATLTAGYTREKRAALVDASAYLARYPELAAAYVTHPVAMKDYQRAFELALRPARGRLKVVLTVD